MNKYNIYVTKEKDLYVALSTDFNLTIEHKSGDEALKILKENIIEYVVDLIKHKKRVPRPGSTSFKDIQKVIAEYQIKEKMMIVHEFDLRSLVSKGRDSIKAKRVNVSLPSYLVDFAKEAELSLSEVLSDSLKRTLGIS